MRWMLWAALAWTQIPLLACSTGYWVAPGAGDDGSPRVEPEPRPPLSADTGLPGAPIDPSLQERCNNQLDDNSDGWVDEHCACDIAVDQGQQACYSGPAATRGKGACHDGTQHCVGDQEFRSWGRCSGEVTPKPEVQGDGIDNDCDGQVDGGGSCAGRPCPCALPWGGSIADGASVEAFASSRVACGDACVRATRTCANGVLSGSGAEPACTPQPCASCPLPWGGTLAHGANVEAFVSSRVPCGGSCVKATHVCVNGALTGGSPSLTCAVASCARCPRQTLTAPTDQPGVTCTDTFEAQMAGWQAFSHRFSGVRCRGTGCLVPGNTCDSTPYFGTVRGGSYGTCENWCAVEARCEDDGTWTVTNWTW